MLKRATMLLLLVACVVLGARVSERHTWQLDVTTRQINTLSEGARQALEQLPERLVLTAFAPDLAVQRAELERMLAPYVAHASRPRLDYIDPVAEPELARERGVGGRIELHLAAGPRREVVTQPSTATIDRALNRLALRGDRWIVSLRGHGEAEIDAAPEGLERFAEHAQALGYRMLSLDPRQVDTLPDNTAVLLIAAPSTPYAAHTLRLLDAYLAAGGRVAWLGGDTLPDGLAERLGVRALPGIVVDAAAARHGLGRPDQAIVSDYPKALLPRPPAQASALLQSSAFALDESEHWRSVARLYSSPLSWNETGAPRGHLARDPDLGEQAGPLPVAAALTHRDSSAKVVLVGSPYLLGNAQLGIGGNLELATGLLRWLSDNPNLASTRPGPTLDITWSPTTAATLAVTLMGGLPLVYLGTGLWLRRRRSRR